MPAGQTACRARWQSSLASRGRTEAIWQNSCWQRATRFTALSAARLPSTRSSDSPSRAQERPVELERRGHGAEYVLEPRGDCHPITWRACEHCRPFCLLGRAGKVEVRVAVLLGAKGVEESAGHTLTTDHWSARSAVGMGGFLCRGPLRVARCCAVSYRASVCQGQGQGREGSSALLHPLW